MKPLKAFGYIRVSKEKKGQISPAVQREAILENAEQRGWEIARFFEDIDRSATKLRPLEMPGFAEMVLRAEAGEVGAILFYRLDRAVREHSGEFDIVEGRLRRAGVDIGFTNRQYDNTPEGQFAIDLDKALSRLETRRLGERLQRMHRTLAAQGKWGGNKPPFGWRRVRDPDGQQRLVLEPAEAEWRRRIHRWYWAGDGLRTIALRLNTAGVMTGRGKPWTPETLSRTLRSGMQTGGREVDGELIRTGRIEPLLTDEEFARTRALIAARSTRGIWDTGRPPAYGLRGSLVRCGRCGSRLYPHAVNARGCMQYRCEGRVKGTSDKCVSIREHLLRPAVEAELFAQLAALEPSTASAAPMADISPLVARKRRVEGSLGRLAAMFAEGALTEPEYRAARAEQSRKLEELEGYISQAAASLDAAAFALSEADYRNLSRVTPEVWSLLEPDEQYHIYRRLLIRVVVNPANGPQPRIVCEWRCEGPNPG